MSWKTEEGPRLRDRDPGPGPEGRDLEDGTWSNLIMEYFSPTLSCHGSGFWSFIVSLLVEEVLGFIGEELSEVSFL